MTCESRTWLKAQKDKARKEKSTLPEQLLTKTSNMCRREGSNYTVQCIDCIPQGLKTLYHGQSSRSSRQRHQEHKSNLDHGLTSSPLVIHALEEHGGLKPKFLYVINNIEGRALYRVVRESVMIGGLPHGPQNMNRCQEWGIPRIPVLSTMGGDPEPGTGPGTGYSAQQQPSKASTEWSIKILNDIKESGLKRVKLRMPEPEVAQVEKETVLSSKAIPREGD